MGIQREILTQFKSKLETLSWPNLVTFDKIRLTADDFREHEIPVIQFYPNVITGTHERGRINAQMQIVVEIVLRQDGDGAVNVLELMDRIQDVEQKIGENVQLGIQNQGMIHVIWQSSTTDLHTVAPFYIGEITFLVNYYKPYTGTC